MTSFDSTANVCVKAYAYPVITGSIVINGDDPYTKTRNVTLTLSSSDGVKYMQFSNDGTTWGNWVKYATKKTYTLPVGDGSKRVYVQFKDAQGFQSPVYSDAITLDMTKPVDGTLVMTSKINNEIQGDWSGFSDVTSDIKESRLMGGTTPPPAFCSGSSISVSSDTTTYDKTDLIAGKTYYVRVCAVDNAGNVSKGATGKCKAVPELDPPTGTILINGGAVTTTYKLVTLTLNITDSNGVAGMCISNTTTCSAWTSFKASKSWTLTPNNEPKTVYGWFKDKYGNTNSSPISASIVLSIPGSSPAE
jgi:hypothetical protein